MNDDGDCIHSSDCSGTTTTTPRPSTKPITTVTGK